MLRLVKERGPKERGGETVENWNDWVAVSSQTIPHSPAAPRQPDRSFTVCFTVPVVSVVEPFHFGPLPAPASQDGGSSSSCVFHNFLLYKKFWIISFPSLLGLFLFPESYECFPLFSVLTALHLKRQIHFLLDCSKFGLFNSLNIGQSWRWSCSRSRPFFHGSGFR